MKNCTMILLVVIAISCTPENKMTAVNSVDTHAKEFALSINNSLEQKHSKMASICKELIRVAKESMQVRCLLKQAQRDNANTNIKKYDNLRTQLNQRYNDLKNKLDELLTEIDGLKIEVAEWDSKHPGWWRRPINLSGINLDNADDCPAPIEANPIPDELMVDFD